MSLVAMYGSVGFELRKSWWYCSAGKKSLFGEMLVTIGLGKRAGKDSVPVQLSDVGLRNSFLGCVLREDRGSVLRRRRLPNAHSDDDDDDQDDDEQDDTNDS
jgi:hypothetical protein